MSNFVQGMPTRSVLTCAPPYHLSLIHNFKLGLVQQPVQNGEAKQCRVGRGTGA